MGKLIKNDETYIHKNSGVCSSAIAFQVEDGIVKNIQFMGGCSGNTQGVAKLAEGLKVEDVIQRVSGIRCGNRPTSCPDQLAKALQAYSEGNY